MHSNSAAEKEPEKVNCIYVAQFLLAKHLIKFDSVFYYICSSKVCIIFFFFFFFLVGHKYGSYSIYST